jgi:hypothetical protein
MRCFSGEPLSELIARAWIGCQHGLSDTAIRKRARRTGGPGTSRARCEAGRARKFAHCELAGIVPSEAAIVRCGGGTHRVRARGDQGQGLRHALEGGLDPVRRCGACGERPLPEPGSGASTGNRGLSGVVRGPGSGGSSHLRTCRGSAFRGPPSSMRRRRAAGADGDAAALDRSSDTTMFYRWLTILLLATMG